jgi:hypothetical protein
MVVVVGFFFRITIFLCRNTRDRAADAPNCALCIAKWGEIISEVEFLIFVAKVKAQH